MKRALVLAIVAAFVVWVTQAQTSIPLPQLLGSSYLGEPGGLYPESNEPPAGYLDEAVSSLEQDSQIVLLCLGMSAMQNMCSGYINGSYPGVTPGLIAINGAIGSKQQNWESASHFVWDRGVQMLTQQGLNESQVDIVIYHNTFGGESRPFPEWVLAENGLRASLQITMDIIAERYPNTKLILVTSRYHAFYAPPDSKSPEPWAYESAWAYKYLIEDRINCAVDCGPPVAWFAYLWDSSWPQSWYVSDGIHLSNEGRAAAGAIWDNFLRTSPYTTSWYLSGPAPTATPTAVPGVTPTATPFPTATPVSTPSWCAQRPWHPACN